MANRLTKIYTRTGDAGSTGMADGSRIDKDDDRVQAIGDIDELNSQLAVLACAAPDEYQQSIKAIQNELFDVGAELAMGQAIITAEYVSRLEQSLDTLNEQLPPLKEFILPGGGQAASHCHLARAICRRAERSLVSLNRSAVMNKNAGSVRGKNAVRRRSPSKKSLHATPVSTELMAYINRLSDYLFVLARSISKAQGEDEVYWQSEKLKQTENQ